MSAAALGLAAAAAGAERFPIGIYDVRDPAHLSALSAAGFDSFFASPPTLEAASALAREARRRGLKMLLPPTLLEGAGLEAVKGWPLEGWYLRDEPDVHRVSPETLAQESARLRARDPGRPQAFSLGQGASARAYGGIGDIVMLDWYPVPHLQLDSIADQIDAAARDLPDGKPLWAILQAMDWRDFPQRDQSKPRIGRFPTTYELRFMTYLAVLHGARGLYYFSLKKSDAETLLDRPELWLTVTEVVREARALQRVFASGRPAPLPFPPNPDGVQARAWRFRGRTYVVVLNRKEGVLQKLPSELLDRRWRPLFEPRRDPKDLLKRIGDAWYLPPRRVLVFEGRFSLDQPRRTW